MPSASGPKRSGSGAWQWMRLPQGETVSTQSLRSRKSKLVPASGARTPSQPLEQGRAVRQHQAGDAAQDLDPAGRQMELALPDIDPHVVGAGIDEGIAGEPEPGHVEQRGQALPRDGGVDVPETDDVADVLDRTIVAGVCAMVLSWFALRVGSPVDRHAAAAWSVLSRALAGIMTTNSANATPILG